MTGNDFQIHELADKAGVSVRTIRFYIKEGLLPPPQVRGRYAVYSDDYLERLELIRLLKDQFLPLKEIRSRTHGLNRDEVRAAISFEQEPDSMQPAPPEELHLPREGNSHALDYVNRLLNQQPSRRPAQNRSEPNSRQSTQGLRAPGEPEEIYPMAEEVWERVYLAPGLELHIQKPVERETRSKLDQLIQFAIQLFNL